MESKGFSSAGEGSLGASLMSLTRRGGASLEGGCPGFPLNKGGSLCLPVEGSTVLLDTTSSSRYSTSDLGLGLAGDLSLGVLGGVINFL